MMIERHYGNLLFPAVLPRFAGWVKMKECREGGEEVMDSEKERDVIIILYYIFGLAHTAPIVPR